MWTDPESGRDYEIGPDGQTRWVEMPLPPLTPPSQLSKPSKPEAMAELDVSQAKGSKAGEWIGWIMLFGGARGMWTSWGHDRGALIFSIVIGVIGLLLMIGSRAPAGATDAGKLDAGATPQG